MGAFFSLVYLIAQFGDRYSRYRNQVGMLLRSRRAQ
jgi:protein-S-isoprenylcysteine O-methyltransferase Ste14